MIFGKHINRYYVKYAGFLLVGLTALIVVDWLQLAIPEYYQLVVNGMNNGYVDLDGVRRIFDMEFLLDENARNCGKPLKQLKLKPNVLIVSITRGTTTEIPNGDSAFCAGDTVVVVTSSGAVLRQFNDIFA